MKTFMLTLATLTLCASCATQPVTAPTESRYPASNQEEIFKPEAFPKTEKLIPASSQETLDSATKFYCKTFREVILGKISEATRSRPAYTAQKVVFERLCSFKNGVDTFSGFADINDHEVTMFVINKLTLEVLSRKAKDLLIGLSSSSPEFGYVKDRYVKNLYSSQEGIHIFYPMERDSQTQPTKAIGILVDLYGDKLSVSEIATRVDEHRTWTTRQVDLAMEGRAFFVGCLGTIARVQKWSALNEAQLKCMSEDSRVGVQFDGALNYLCTADRKEVSAPFASYVGFYDQYSQAQRELLAASDDDQRMQISRKMNTIRQDWVLEGNKADVERELEHLGRAYATCTRK